MAVYTRSGGRGSLPPNSNGNLPVSTQSNFPTQKQEAPLASKEISEILIHSMQTVTEALEGKDVPVNGEQIEKSVTKGINKSVIAKKENLPNKNNDGMAPGGATDKAAADYWKQKQYNEWKKEQDRQAKLDDESRKQRDSDWNEKVDKFFAGLNSWSNNPLKGFSDLLDKGVKGLFKGVGKTMDMSVGEFGKHMKAEAGKVLAPVKTAGTLIGTGLKTVGKGVIYGAATASLIKDKIALGKEDKSVTSEISQTVDEEKPVEGEIKQKENKKESDVIIPDEPKKAEVLALPAPKSISENENETPKETPKQAILALPAPESSKQNISAEVSEENESENIEKETIEEVVKDEEPTTKEVTTEKDDNDTNAIAIKENEDKAQLAELITADNEEEAEADADRDESNAQLGELVEQGEDSKKLTELKMGLIIGGIAAVGAAIPALWGKIGKVMNNIPFYFDDIKIKVGLLLNGPNSIFNQIQRAIKASLAKLANIEGDDLISKALRGIGGKFAYGADEELLEKQQTAKQNVYNKIQDLGYGEDTAKFVVENFNNKGAKKYNINDFSTDTGFDVTEAFQNKSDKKEYKNKFKNKPLSQWDKSDLMWFKSRLPPEKYAEVEKAYETGVALTELANVNEEVKNSKNTLIDYDQQGQDAKQAELEEFNKRQAESRISKYQSGQISSADLMTDKSWTENPELVKFVAESGPDFFNNLKQNSKGEQLTQDGLEYLNAIKKTFGDIAKDFTGKSNSWSEAEQNNALNRIKQVNETHFGITVNSPGTGGSAFMCK